MKNCGFDYEDDSEEKTYSFCTEWNNCLTGGITPVFPEYWTYRTSQLSGTYDMTARITSYPGSGYSVDLGKSRLSTENALRYLRDHKWLDDFTRGVFVDFTVYNSQANFYCMVMFLLEIPANGGAFSFKRILTTRLDRYSSGFAVFLAVCEILFLSISIYYVVREVKKWRLSRSKYFTKWENWVEITSFALIWTTFALLIVRLGIVSATKKSYFAEPDSYVNFDAAALSDQFYGYTLACLVFILFIKFLKLLRFNKKMSLMFKTVAHASKDTKYFSFSFFIITAAFAHFAHLIFMSYIFEYSSMVYTLESLFSMMLGSIHYHSLIVAAPILGKWFFAAYFTFMTFILLNMFICIINESFAIIQEALHEKKNKYELIDFLTQRIRSFLPRSLTRIKLKKKNSSVDDVNDNNETVVVYDVPPTISSEQLAALLEKPSLVQPKTTSKKRATSSQQPTTLLEEPTTSSQQSKALFEQVTASSTSSGQLTQQQQLQPLNACKQRVDCIENTLASLCFAICRLEERVDEMQREEEIEDKMWRYTLELILIKYSINNKSKDEVCNSGDMQIENRIDDNLQEDGSEVVQRDNQETENQETKD